MKRLLVVLGCITCLLAAYAQGDYGIYAYLYKDCVDDEESPIYGGSYSNYPPELVDAQFPGGDVELSLFIYKNTERQEVYSGETDAEGNALLVTGEVLVQFVIDRCGKPGRFQVVQSLTEEQDAEALRVMESLPIFKSASIDGIRVKSAYIAPVKFRWKTMPPKEPETPSYESDNFFDEWSDSGSDDDWW
jgi:hypothetical protein